MFFFPRPRFLELRFLVDGAASDMTSCRDRGAATSSLCIALYTDAGSTLSSDVTGSAGAGGVAPPIPAR